MSDDTAHLEHRVEVRLTAEKVMLGDQLPELRIEVTPRTVVMGASASRDWQPQHHDHVHCTEVANLPGIFLNTPHQAGYMERYLTDWAGPHARLAKLSFRMKKSVIPGNTMVFTGVVSEIVADADITEVGIDIELRVDDTVVTYCTARLAIPSTENDNPWNRRGTEWTP
ncbi:MAG: acyl dehydratase [Glaciecola sp.]|jgi:acyl dehydratase